MNDINIVATQQYVQDTVVKVNDSLTSESVTEALSANQGRILNEKIENSSSTFVVNMSLSSMDEESGEPIYAFDKTYDEIKAAIDSGQLVYVNNDGNIFYYSGTIDDGYNFRSLNSGSTSEVSIAPTGDIYIIEQTTDNEFQQTTSDELNTTDKSIVGAINEVNDKASVLPDWEVNDETSASYIQNRPFYDNRKIVIGEKEVPINFTFDGNIEDKEVIDLGGNDYLVKMSDIPLTRDYLIGSNVIGMYYEEQENYDITEDDIDEETESYIIAFNGNFISVFQDNTEINGYTLSKGFWCWCNLEYYYYASFTNTKSITVIGEIIEGDLKKIDEKYLPETHRCREIVLVDKVTGLDYIISMVDGKIHYDSLCKKIEIVKSPLIPFVGTNANSEVDLTGIFIIAHCENGSIKEVISDYTYTIDTDNGVVTIIYTERGKEFTASYNAEVLQYSEDFTYSVNDDGTYTITGWKGTCNGEPSTEMILPNHPSIIL